MVIVRWAKIPKLPKDAIGTTTASQKCPHLDIYRAMGTFSRIVLIVRGLRRAFNFMKWSQHQLFFKLIQRQDIQCRKWYLFKDIDSYQERQDAWIQRDL